MLYNIFLNVLWCHFTVKHHHCMCSMLYAGNLWCHALPWNVLCHFQVLSDHMRVCLYSMQVFREEHDKYKQMLRDSQRTKEGIRAYTQLLLKTYTCQVHRKCLHFCFENA